MMDLKPVYTGKFRERFPNIRAAGKLLPMGGTVATCLLHPRTFTPPLVEKFLVVRRPKVATRRLWHGKANDPQVENEITHGICSAYSLPAGLQINPEPKTLFQQKLIDKGESIYSSQRWAPLGTSHDQIPSFPEGTKVHELTFGDPTKRGIPAGELINPPKTSKEVHDESQKGHELYAMTHNDYNVGEKKDRKYDWSNFKTDTFGMPTPCFHDGRLTSKTLHWLHDLQMKKAAQLVPKRVDDFRERSQPQIGKILDPIIDTLNVPPDHTFGLPIIPDGYGVAEILRYKAPTCFLYGKDRYRAALSTVRQHMKNICFHDFHALLEAFRHYDKNNNGKISRDHLKNVCEHFNLELYPELLDAILEYCGVDEVGLIDFVLFTNFINWKKNVSAEDLAEKISSRGWKTERAKVDEKVKLTDTRVVNTLDVKEQEQDNSEETPKSLTKPSDQVLNDYHTTSAMINGVVGGFPTTYYKVGGVPSVRTDIPVPRVRRFTDRISYGDEANVFGLLSPSIFSQKGIHESDFFESRPKEEVAEIFRNIGVNISDDTFEAVWKLAAQRHPKGEVCVETFRNVLDEIQASNMRAS
ncbi:EF-hand domain-containing family member B [Microcaecilia unicolor]|uniref:EF-hand domain-containing family member B n=1 Tax=Microcaecilia unicolor TaxID=1415580 RepID=A0A6P7YAE0_9AMPH|nr:EF-hand domain-containing family member B [Microcaecilia unicolor]